MSIVLGDDDLNRFSLDTLTHIYLPLQHGDFIREEACDVAFPKGLGQEVAYGGAHSGEQTSKQQSLIRPEYSSGKNVLHGDSGEKAWVKARC